MQIQLQVASILHLIYSKNSDVAVLSKHLAQLTSLKSELNKVKDEVVAMDRGLFDVLIND